LLQVTPKNAKKITKATLVLHNRLRDQHPNIQNGELDEEAEDGRIIPGAWRDAGVMRDVEAQGRGPRATVQGKELRAYLKHYYNSEVGSVPWQEAALNAPIN
jgi:hypothetical protein